MRLDDALGQCQAHTEAARFAGHEGTKQRLLDVDRNSAAIVGYVDNEAGEIVGSGSDGDMRLRNAVGSLHGVAHKVRQHLHDLDAVRKHDVPLRFELKIGTKAFSLRSGKRECRRLMDERVHRLNLSLVGAALGEFSDVLHDLSRPQSVLRNLGQGFTEFFAVAVSMLLYKPPATLRVCGDRRQRLGKFMSQRRCHFTERDYSGEAGKLVLKLLDMLQSLAFGAEILEDHREEVSFVVLLSDDRQGSWKLNTAPRDRHTRPDHAPVCPASLQRDIRCRIPDKVDPLTKQFVFLITEQCHSSPVAGRNSVTLGNEEHRVRQVFIELPDPVHPRCAIALPQSAWPVAACHPSFHERGRPETSGSTRSHSSTCGASILMDTMVSSALETACPLMGFALQGLEVTTFGKRVGVVSRSLYGYLSANRRWKGLACLGFRSAPSIDSAQCRRLILPLLWQEWAHGHLRSRKMMKIALAIAIASAALVAAPVDAQQTRKEYRRMNWAENLPEHIRNYHDKRFSIVSFRTAVEVGAMPRPGSAEHVKEIRTAIRSNTWLVQQLKAKKLTPNQIEWVTRARNGNLTFYIE